MSRRGVWLGAALVGTALAAALLSLVWTPEDPTRMRFALRLSPPSWGMPLGADAFGRDVASILMAMGMMMVSPATVSLPLKIALFVSVDGWSLVLGALAKSFGS